MKLVAITRLTVPEGSFSTGEEFTTTDDIGARVVAGGYARPFAAAAPVAQREPEVEHRDPATATSRRRRK
jgi:hypothetical protein